MGCKLAFLLVLLGSNPVVGQTPVSRYVPHERGGKTEGFFHSPNHIPTVPSVRNAARGPIIPVQDSQEPKKFSREDLLEYQIRLDPPEIEIWSRLESEKALEERMRQEAIQRRQEAVRFPDRSPLTNSVYKPRTFPANTVLAEPSYVSHGRLYFEERNAERYGWDLGFIQPVVSTLYFYKDVLFLPHNIASYPFRCYDSSAGKCLPGDPVPYIFYPPGFTLSGGLAQAGVIIGLVAIFP